MQLDLPFQSDVVEAWTIGVGKKGGDRGLMLAVALTRSGVEASMVVAGSNGCDGWDGVLSLPPSNWRVRLNVRHPVDAVIRLDDQQESMNEADIPVARPGQSLPWGRMSLFAKPFNLARRLLGRSVLSQEAGWVARSFQLMANHLDRLWVEGGAAAAAPFPLKGGMRWFVYSLVVADKTGRVAQMARTCPGILILCKALKDHGGTSRCSGLLQSIIAGRRLGRVLDEAVDAWSRVRSDCPFSKAMGVPDGPVHDEDRVAQGLRIRRAGSLVPSWILWRRVPGCVVPEDIPGEQDGNRGWFLATSGFWLDRARERLSPVQLNGLIGFLSRNWRWAGEGKNADAQDRAVFMDHLVDYLANTGRAPDRRCSPRRLMERVDRWEYNLMRHPQYYDPSVRLETHGLGLWEGEQGKMGVISTVGELVEESRRMGHCVSAYAEEGVMGRAIFFHGDLNGEAVTVQLEPREDDRRFHLVETAGSQNRHISPEGKAIMWRWLAELNEPQNSRK